MVFLLLLKLATAAAYSPAALSSPITAHALRLLPGDDLVDSLLIHCEAHELTAVAVLTCVGSLSCVTLRMAGADDIVTFSEELEIVSAVGTLCADRNHHLHLALSRRDGSVIGGHCKGAATVRTTAEIVLGVMPALAFSREFESATGYKELAIETLQS